MKFGGTSVGSAERIRAVAKIIKAALSRKPVVIVSAMAGVTNSILEIANEKSRSTRLEMVEALEKAHRTVLSDLELAPSLLDKEFKELIVLAKKKLLLNAKRLDHFVSFGERLSAPIVAEQLQKIGVQAKSFPSWEVGMITNSNFSNAEPLPTSSALIRKKISFLAGVPVITGFIGHTKTGDIITLGRGGSDYSAAIFGAALSAEAIQIWKEVDGIMTTDPRIISEAKVVPELAFEEACELAYFGAKVLHPKTILPAMEKGVPVQVLNTFNPSGKGTTIVSSFAERRNTSHTVEALTFKKGVTAVHVRSPAFFDGTGLMANIFETFEKYGISIDVISTSVASVSLTIDKIDHLDDLVRDLEKFGQVEVERGKAIVCAVGGSVNAAGVAGRMFTVLGENKIPVEMISQAAFGISITFVVSEEDAVRALQVLHKEYIG